MSPKTCIYEGTIRHRRFEPVRHQFRSRLFMMYVDLDELPSVFDRFWLWSSKRPNLAWFRRSDYFDKNPGSLAEAIRTLIRSRFGVTHSGPIRLLTHLRYFGYSINPISLYYCFNADDEVDFVVAEVTNTPWREKHAYAFDARPNQSPKMKFSARKALHVSPFMEMNYEYQFWLNQPAECLSVQIENHKLPPEAEHQSIAQPPVFDATLTLQRKPLTSLNLARVLCRYPVMTAQVFAMIHWQALRLWVKKTPLQPHPSTLLADSKLESEPVTQHAPVEKTVS